MKTLTEVKNSMVTVINFIQKYEAIGDVHMVEYFTKDHWNVLLSESCRSELVKKDIDDMYKLPEIVKCYDVHDHIASENPNKFVVSHLQEYISAAKECQLTSLNMLTRIKDVIATLISKSKQEVIQTSKVDSKEFMSGKKSHEVEKMSSLVHIVALHCNTPHVLDIGSGKGYLSTHLSLKYGMKVTAVDCNDDNTTNASQRAMKCLSYWKKHLNGRETRESAAPVINEESLKLKSVTAHVAASTDPTNFLPDDGVPSDECACVVTGLHTCGDLCSSVVSMFVANKPVKGMCVVGCCYHHISESNDENATFPMSDFLATSCFRLGRNKRMLGLKAPERHAAMDAKSQRDKSERSLFYRAVLSVILEEKYSVKSDRKDACIGKVFSKSQSFLDYIRRCINKLKLNNSLLSDEEINSYLQSYEHRFKELVAFSMIRHQYGPAVESIIVLDKYLYLLEQAQNAGIEKCFISEAFDPVLSPRCYALIAVKSTM